MLPLCQGGVNRPAGPGGRLAAGGAIAWAACDLGIRVGLALVLVGMTMAAVAEGKVGAEDHTLCFEAEHANEVTPIVHVVRKEGASGGIALCIPEGAGARSGTEDEGHALYYLTIPADGTYYTWFRVWWQGTCSNSIFCSLPPVLPRFTVMGNTFYKWHWVHGPLARLSAGATAFRISYREDGVWVDEILFTTQADADPKGTMPPNTIPTPPPDQREMTVSLFADALACGTLTAPRLRVTTHMDRTAPIPPDQSIVMIPGRETKLTAWLRNNALDPGAGTVSFASPSKIVVQPAATQPFRVDQGQPLAAVDFTLRAPPDLARRSHRSVLRSLLPSGKVEATALNVECPFQWLCSEAMPFSGKQDVDASHPIEQSPNPLQVGRWRMAPDEATTPIGLLNMRIAVSEQDYVMAYAYTEVRPPRAGSYLLYTANDDMMKVWVNGKMVHREDSEQPTSATRALTPVELVEGPNRILVKICQKRNFWEFLLEVRNADGSPSEVEGCDVARLLHGHEPK